MQPKDLYISCLTLSVLSLFGGLVIGVLTFFAMAWDRTTDAVHDMFGTSTLRTILVGLVNVVMLMTLASWTLFVMLLPTVLSGATMCSAENNKWCHSFAGRYDDDETSVVWFPWIGWMCAVGASVPMVALAVLVQVIRRHTNRPNPHAELEPMMKV